MVYWMPKITTFSWNGIFFMSFFESFFGLFIGSEIKKVASIHDNWKNNTIFAINNNSFRHIYAFMELNGILAIFNLGTGEVIAIVAIILLLFGGKKIPELMRGLGKGVKSFKQGMNEVEDEFKKPLDELDGKDDSSSK